MDQERKMLKQINMFDIQKIKEICFTKRACNDKIPIEKGCCCVDG